jgi:hypothetical protein
MAAWPSKRLRMDDERGSDYFEKVFGGQSRKERRHTIFQRQLALVTAIRERGGEPIRSSSYEDFWRQAVGRGLASQDDYEAARDAYKDDFYYAGD